MSQVDYCNSVLVGVRFDHFMSLKTLQHLTAVLTVTDYQTATWSSILCCIVHSFFETKVVWQTSYTVYWGGSFSETVAQILIFGQRRQQTTNFSVKRTTWKLRCCMSRDCMDFRRSMLETHPRLAFSVHGLLQSHFTYLWNLLCAQLSTVGLQIHYDDGGGNVTLTYWPIPI